MMLQIAEYLVRISTNVLRPSQNLKNYRFACGAVFKFTWNPSYKISIAYIVKVSEITRKIQSILWVSARSLPDNHTISDAIVQHKPCVSW